MPVTSYFCHFFLFLLKEHMVRLCYSFYIIKVHLEVKQNLCIALPITKLNTEYTRDYFKSYADEVLTVEQMQQLSVVKVSGSLKEGYSVIGPTDWPFFFLKEINCEILAPNYPCWKKQDKSERLAYHVTADSARTSDMRNHKDPPLLTPSPLRSSNN